MRSFPIAFAANSTGCPGTAFSRLSGSSVIWGTKYNRKNGRERERERERKREKERERERERKRERERERGGGRESISKHHRDLTLFFTCVCTVTIDVYSMYDAA